jgi:hypothetical protein
LRQITSHIVNPANDKLEISVLDEPGSGGANHLYEISGFDASANPSFKGRDSYEQGIILFQNGPIGEFGVNGITQEVLLAIVADRLQSFQKGPFASDLNAKALGFVEQAQEALLSRTRERMARGVEGTHKA